MLHGGVLQSVASEPMDTTGRCPLIAATVPIRAPESLAGSGGNRCPGRRS
jgi:hypothetical protein